MRDLSSVEVHLVDNVETAENFMRWLGEVHARDTIAVDTETGGLEWWKQPLRLVQFGDLNTGWAIPWEHWGGVAIEALCRFQGKLVGHNLKFDAHFITRELHEPWPWNRSHDTMVQAHLLDPAGVHALKPLATRYVNNQSQGGQAKLDHAMKAQGWGWDTVPVKFEPYWAYGALDAVLTAHLHDERYPLIKSRGLSDVYELEIAVLDTISRMESYGMRIDLDHVHSSTAKIDNYLVDVEAFCKATWGVRVGSNDQLIKYFSSIGIELTKRTPSGKNYAMDRDVLESIGHPLAMQALRYRQAQKIRSTYLVNFLQLVDGDKLHCSVRTLGARTGRMSITDPALQTLPRSDEGNPFAITVRDCFIPSTGCKLISADYDQIEYRVLTHFAEKDLPEGMRPLYEAIMRGDIHTESARTIYGDPSITKKDPRRQITKNAGFAILYGAGLDKFAATARVSIPEAQQFLTMYHATFPAVHAFTESVDRVARQRLMSDGVAYVRSPLGRMHPANGDHFYALVNYLIQGTSADVLKEALVRLDQAGLGPYMRLPVHDEVIFDVPDAEVDDLKYEIERVMRDDRWLVPLTVGAESYDRWGDKYR